jgi:hypothetical protein
MASAKTEKKLKTVVDMAERSASRMVGFILEERRGRGRREAAAVELKKKSAHNRADAAKVPKNAEAQTEARRQAETSSPLPASPARRQAETSSPLPASPEPNSQRRSAFSLSKRRSSFSLSTPQSPAALAALHETPDDQLKRKHDLKEMPEVPRGLALNESGDCIGTEPSTLKEQFQQSPVVAPNSVHWHAKEVKVSHKMLMNLKNSDLELLASFERPPQVVELVMLAVHDLLGIQSLSWAGMKKMLHSDVPKPGDRHNERLPHEKFQAALTESASHRSWRPPGEKASEYPAPVKQQHVARIIKLVLEYTGQGRDPKEVQSMLKKYVSNPEFTVENAGKWSKAALALCVWVHAIDLHNKELTRKPRRGQIERAIENGSGYLRLPSNTRVWVSVDVVMCFCVSVCACSSVCLSVCGGDSASEDVHFPMLEGLSHVRLCDGACVCLDWVRAAGLPKKVFDWRPNLAYDARFAGLAAGYRSPDKPEHGHEIIRRSSRIKEHARSQSLPPSTPKVAS